MKTQKKKIVMGAVCTLSDLKVWVEEVMPEIIFIPKNHPLRHIKEFNPNREYSWNSFRGIPINYENS